MVVLVNSCDRYADVWPVFFHLFFKYWPDCPYLIYLGSNKLTFPDSRVQSVCVGPDRSWSDSARLMVEQLPGEHFLFFLDDYFLWSRVSTDRIQQLRRKMAALDANYIRMRPEAGRDCLKRKVDEDLLELLPGCGYRASLDNAFWKKRTFLSLIQPGESPWQMEIKGSRRSDPYAGFYATRYKVFQRTNGLEKGKWLRYNIPLLDREGLLIPPGHPVMSRCEHLARALNRWMWQCLGSLSRGERILKRKPPHE
jgi:hypothetical protein